MHLNLLRDCADPTHAGGFEGSAPKPAPPSDHIPLVRRCAAPRRVRDFEGSGRFSDPVPRGGVRTALAARHAGFEIVEAGLRLVAVQDQCLAAQPGVRAIKVTGFRPGGDRHLPGGMTLDAVRREGYVAPFPFEEMTVHINTEARAGLALGNQPRKRADRGRLGRAVAARNQRNGAGDRTDDGSAKVSHPRIRDDEKAEIMQASPPLKSASGFIKPRLAVEESGRRRVDRGGQSGPTRKWPRSRGHSSYMSFFIMW